MRRWILIVVMLVGGWYAWNTRAVSHPPGVLVAASPLQTALDGAAPELPKRGYQITPLERFALEARVLGAEQYRFDRGAELAPVDLALGWGPMSDSAILDQVDISQSDRFYFWRVAAFPIPRREIETNSANMHMIPGTSEVEDRLKSVRRGQIVRLSGYLVDVRAPDGFHWRSSLTRDDTGNGACELVWVEALKVQ